MNITKPIDAAAGTGVLARATPESVGLSGPALDRIDAAIGEFIGKGQLSGVVTLVARHGRLVHLHAQGKKNVASGEPMAIDTIFRIYSMTKPVTGAAMMILYDRGLWLPEDPISKHLPQFKGVRVFVGLDDAGKAVTAPADHEPTMVELMTHTAGLSYGFMPDDPLDGLYRGVKMWKQPSLDAFATAVASLPLAYQPGLQWKYSLSMDIQGAIIERLSGQSLPDFMRENLFEPLGMVDTGFFVPADKWPRLASLYRSSKSRGLVEADASLMNTDHSSLPAVPSGGGGLASSIQDYARFAQMMLSRGEFDGKRIIQAASVELMTSNHLSDALLNGGFGVGFQAMRPGFGQGFDCAVYYDPPLTKVPVGKGTFQWDGAAGTWFWCDPENDLLFIGMIQHFGDLNSPQLQVMTQRLMAEAIL